jgi:uncharacterized protein
MWHRDFRVAVRDHISLPGCGISLPGCGCALWEWRALRKAVLGTLMEDDQKQRPESLLPYERWIEQALRHVVAQAIEHVARDGLPGGHHFYITFRTNDRGVEIPSRMRAQYPQEMTVVLQHQFWDLTVNDEGFEVGLSFGGVPERLGIPFAVVKSFFDPSVEFGLQFEQISEEIGGAGAKEASAVKKGAGEQVAAEPKRTAPATLTAVPAAANRESDEGAQQPEPDKPAGGGEVVRLDRFRKK